MSDQDALEGILASLYDASAAATGRLRRLAWLARLARAWQADG